MNLVLPQNSYCAQLKHLPEACHISVLSHQRMEGIVGCNHGTAAHAGGSACSTIRTLPSVRAHRTLYVAHGGCGVSRGHSMHHRQSLVLTVTMRVISCMICRYINLLPLSFVPPTGERDFITYVASLVIFGVPFSSL